MKNPKSQYDSFAEALGDVANMKIRVHAILPVTNENRTIYSDGISIFSPEHPRPPFLKRICQAVKAVFIRPRLSKGSVLPAEHFIINTAGQRHPSSCTYYHCF